MALAVSEGLLKAGKAYVGTDAEWNGSNVIHLLQQSFPGEPVGAINLSAMGILQAEDFPGQLKMLLQLDRIIACG